MKEMQYCIANEEVNYSLEINYRLESNVGNNEELDVRLEGFMENITHICVCINTILKSQREFRNRFKKEE